MAERMQFSWLQAEVGHWGQLTFPQATDATILAHLREEVDEMAAVLGAAAVTRTLHPDGLEEELADVMHLLCHLGYRHGIDLERALRAKFAVNKERRWKAQPEPAGHTKHEEE